MQQNCHGVKCFGAGLRPLNHLGKAEESGVTRHVNLESILYSPTKCIDGENRDFQPWHKKLYESYSSADRILGVLP